MNDWLTVVGRNLDRGVRAACGCPADEQRQFEALTLHLAGDMYHLIERWSDQAAEADHVGLFGLGAFENFFTWDHHAHVDHFIVIACENDADDVLADIVNVTFDRGEHDFSLCLDHLAGGSHRHFFGLHEWSQMRHGLLHHSGGFDDLGQEHLAGSEQITDDTHAIHQRPFDHQ